MSVRVAVVAGCEHVEEHRRLRQRDRRNGRIVTGERRQVGDLLLVGAPQRDRRGDRARGQRSDRDAEIALGQSLRDERAGHRRALVGQTAERLGDAEDGKADLVAGPQHCLRRRAGSVSRRGGRADHLGGELGDDVDEHLLVVRGCQVEDAAVRGRARAVACTAAPAGPGEGAASGGRRTEAAAGHCEDGLLGLLADAEPVEQLALGQPVHGGDGVADRVAALAGRHSVAGRPGGGGHEATVTTSYTGGQAGVRVATHTYWGVSGVVARRSS